MKKEVRLWVVAVLIAWCPLQVRSQDCGESYKKGDCKMDLHKGYKTFSQSRGFSVTPKDTVELSVVFYGQKDYILSFCTHHKFYPVHYKLIDHETGDVLYDNEKDNYIESLGVGFDVTKSLTLRVNVLAREATEDEIREYNSCLGLLIQYRSYPDKKVKLQM